MHVHVHEVGSDVNVDDDAVWVAAQKKPKANQLTPRPKLSLLFQPLFALISSAFPTPLTNQQKITKNMQTQQIPKQNK